MSRVLVADDATAATTDRPRPGGLVPGVLVLVVVVTGLVAVGTPLLDVLRYGLYVLWAVVLPGTLVHRALRGRPDTLVSDLGLGAATGTCLNLLAWALTVAIGAQSVAWAWPLLVVVPFLAVAPLRQHWRIDPYPVRLGGPAWALAACLGLYAVPLIATSMRNQDLPPRASFYYLDVYWHLGNAAELSRQIPPEVPSVAGRTLRYHWFASADMAQAHLVSGVDLPTVILRLWSIPVVAIVLCLVFALTRKLSGASWPGCVAAFLLVAPAQLMPWSWHRPWSSYSLTEGSPSQIFCLVSLLLALNVLVDLARGRRVGAGWVVLVLAALLAPGSKPSVLPVLIAGIVVALVVGLVRRRLERPLLVALALLAVSSFALSGLVAQATAASGVKLFGLLLFQPAWSRYASEVEQPATGGLVLPGMTDTASIVLASAVVLSILLQFIWILLGLVLLRGRTRTDGALGLLWGATVAGIGVTFVVDHAGASEIYFARAATPIGAVLAAWGAYEAWERAGDRRRRLLGAAVGVAVAVIGYVAISITARGPQPPVEENPSRVALPLVVLAAVVAFAAVAWWLTRRSVPGIRGAGTVAVAVAVVVGFGYQGVHDNVKRVVTAATSPQPDLPPERVTAAETRAALWVKENTSPDDVIATNVHCVTKVTMPECDGRSYWVTGLTERRALVESWAYTEENLRRIGEFPTPFPLFPFDDQPLFRANEQAFSQPTAAGLRELRERGVRWLFADRNAGPVSPDLRQLADVRYENSQVQVLELR